MPSSGRGLPLNKLRLVGPGRRSVRHPGDWINPIGLTVWPGASGMLVVFTLKRWLFLGPLVLHSLDLRGFYNRRRRQEIVGSGKCTYALYLRNWWRYLGGRTLRRMDEVVSPGPRGEQWVLKQRRR